MATHAEARPQRERDLPTATIPRSYHRHVPVTELAADLLICLLLRDFRSRQKSVTQTVKNGGGIMHFTVCMLYYYGFLRGYIKICPYQTVLSGMTWLSRRRDLFASAHA